MIISDENEYLFLATPRTGSTAISSELCNYYAGRRILHKHANYHEFARLANKKQKEYFVFAGVRNPMDDTVSVYRKLKTNHDGAYTDPQQWVENGGWVTRRLRKYYHFVQKSSTNFADFLHKYYKTPYTSRININKPFCDYVVRFESLQTCFSEALNLIGLEQIRPLPVVNPTKRTDRFVEYYQSKEAIAYAAKVFAPFMLEWGYEFPDNIFHDHISSFYFSLYELGKAARKLYSRMVARGMIGLFDRIPF